MRARAGWYPRQLERARDARREARAGRACGHCGTPLGPERPASARWCSVACRKAADYLRHRPASVTPRGSRPPRPRRTPRPRARAAARELPPVPYLERCELVDAAVAQLRPWERAELGTEWDSTARELVGEYVLAALEGADPAAAMEAARRRMRGDRARLVRGSALVTGLER